MHALHPQTATRMSTLDEAALQQFARDLRGPLLRPDDANYDAARTIWNAMIDRRPALIVRCAGVADVVEAVNFARTHDLVMSIRGGGHNVAGYAVCDDGLMIDLSTMNGVWVDPQKRTAHVQGGALWGDVDRETQLFGLATPGGVVSHTGVAGLTLGGGFGYLSRKYGLSADNLLSATVVTADGRVVTANADENADLFWAIRGGGGNFGVVTSFEFQLHPVGPMVQSGLVLYPLDDARNVLHRYRTFAANSPDEVFSVALMRIAPVSPVIPEEIHGKPVVGILASYAGSVVEGEAVLRPLQELGTPLVNGLGPKPYTLFQSALDATQPHGRHYYWKSEYFAELSDDLIDTAIEYAATISSPHSVIGFFQLGGAIGHIPAAATAYGQRDAAFVLNISSSWLEAAEGNRHMEWTRQFWTAVQPFSTGGGYINFLSVDDSAERVQAALGANYTRLVAVKNKYDPKNLFRMNQNIKPTV